MKKIFLRFFLILFFVVLYLASPLTTNKVYASVIFSDDFNRPDASTLGPNWTAFYGGAPAGINNNQAYITTGPGGNWGLYKVVGLDAQDQDVTTTFVHQNGDSVVLARVVDVNNRIAVSYYKSAEVLQIYEVYQGNYRAILNSAPNSVVGDTYTIRISAVGNVLQVWVNGIQYVNTTLNHVFSGSAGFGANDGYTNVLFDNFVVTSDTSTPIPTPTITPIPTPTASASATPTSTPSAIPVSKVVFLPGAGGSWNADAILNCKVGGYSGNWTLAPFAKDVYKNLLTVLPAVGWNTKPFYYDWRKDVRTTASLLSSFISSSTTPGEKVDLVGHSMGGLVSRAYLESNHDQNKISSFLSAGSPYEGSALAYPLVSAGEVWDNNLITKIATTLLLKRCGIVLGLTDKQIVQYKFPATLNVLPTVDYIKNTATGQFKSVDDMVAQNNWLPTNFATPFWGVKVGTLSGTGYPTLRVIPVTNPPTSDINKKMWLDGKPVGSNETTYGDGTVLTHSSQIPGALNKIIPENHEGLVSSINGMAEIIKFLGNSPQGNTQSTMTPSIDSNSALVIVGYPGNFWVTDKDGKVTKDENGMVSYINPKSGSYKLGLVPQTSDTLFIVAQFLSGGQILYKEYNFTNLSPKFKTLEFNTQSPIEDIVVN